MPTYYVKEEIFYEVEAPDAATAAATYGELGEITSESYEFIGGPDGWEKEAEELGI